MEKIKDCQAGISWVGVEPNRRSLFPVAHRFQWHCNRTTTSALSLSVTFDYIHPFQVQRVSDAWCLESSRVVNPVLNTTIPWMLGPILIYVSFGSKRSTGRGTWCNCHPMFISTTPKNYWSHCELSERVIRGQFETWIQDEKIKFNHFVWGGEWESNPTRALNLPLGACTFTISLLSLNAWSLKS